ncbi:MAG: hypothetical protein AB7T06_29320 [Kofleriaceae bacterium]
MAFDVVTATGSGDVAVRLVIGGSDVEFVSDAAMQKTTSDGRRRLKTLPDAGKGLIIEEKVNLQEPKLEVGGNSFRLEETVDEDVSRALHRLPSIQRWLAQDADATDTTIYLLSTSGIVAGDIVYIGAEAILVGAVASGPPRLTGCTRGHWDTIAVKHWTRDADDQVPYAPVTDRPLRQRGRDAFVYLYDDGDDLQGDGELVWTGFINSEPTIDEAGLVFSLQISSAAERLSQEIGGGLDVPIYPRGIYYPWSAPVVVQLLEKYTGGGSKAVPPQVFVGFFEGQLEFLGASDGSDAGSFNEFLKDLAATYSLDSVYRAVVDPLDPSKWTIEIVVGSNTDGISITVTSFQDGQTSSRDDANLLRNGGAPSYATGEVLYVSWDFGPLGGRTVPRGFLGDASDFTAPGAAYRLPRRADGTLRSTYPEQRLYLADELASDLQTLAIAWPTAGSITYPVQSVDTGNDSVDLDRPILASRTTVPPGWNSIYTSETLPSITRIRSIASGSLADFRDALVTEAIEFADRGTAPLLTSAHLADWSAAVAEAGRNYFQLGRRWSLARPVELQELLQAEWAILGVFPYVTADGKIGIRTLKPPNTSQVSALAIDEEIISVAWSSLSTGGQTINGVKLSRGYSPIEDDYTLGPWDVNDHGAQALDHRPRRLEIEPKSFVNGGDGLVSYEDFVDAVLPALMLFGYPFDVVKVHVSWKLFSLLLGDNVSFFADHLPSRSSGRRPKNNVAGIVIGRRWEVSEPYGTLTLLLSGLNVAGYGPSARVTSQSNVSGNTWDLTINNSLYAPAGHTVDEFFEIDDKVRVVQYDSESPTVVTGTVVSSASGVIRVTFDATWTPGSTTWSLRYQDYTVVQASQKRFCFIADSTAILGSGDEARVFAP